MMSWVPDLESYKIPQKQTKKIPTKKFHIDNEKRKWYYRIVDKDDNEKYTTPLLREHSIGEISDKLLICQYRENRLFTLFDSYFQFVSILDNYEPENLCFYEVVFGDFMQKPHFDIDINLVDGDKQQLDKNLIMNQVVEAIVKTLKCQNIELNLSKDVLVFSSHSSSKISFHIVIDNYCHCNNLEAKQFYKKVMKELPTEFENYVDSAVYSKVQQFRIVRSQKYKSGRPKKFLPVWDYFGKTIIYEFLESPENERHKQNMLTGASLLSNSSYCNLLPSFFMEEDVRPGKQEYGDISEKEVHQVLELMSSLDIKTKSTYEILSVVGGIISLRRLRPSKCSICQRVHEAENPYLIVIEGNVYFDCRRAGGKKMYLGRIEMEKYTPEIKQETKSLPITIPLPGAIDWLQIKLAQLASTPSKPVKEPDNYKISKITEEVSEKITTFAMKPESMLEWGVECSKR